MEIRKITIGDPNAKPAYAIVVGGKRRVSIVKDGVQKYEFLAVERIQKYGRSKFRVWVENNGVRVPVEEFENQTIKVEYDIFPEADKTA